MEAGALGVEIVISGKLRTERARFEKFRAGYFPRCGEPALRYMKKAEMHVQLKPGMIGVRVKLMPPDAQFPDKIRIKAIEILPEEELPKTVEQKAEVDAAETAPADQTEAISQETTEIREVTEKPSVITEPVEDTIEDEPNNAGKSVEADQPKEAE
jgi:small subunit ribosomal protein S3